MKSIFNYFFIVLFIAQSTSLSAQVLSARVYDIDTKEPIIGASVYYDGTTIGTATDINGQFELKFDQFLSVPVIISFIGYTTAVYKKSDLLKVKEIFLESSETIMNEVVIQPDNWSREKKMAIFKAQFLGRANGTEFCRIVNQKDIKLAYNATANELYAFCDQPLIVRNKYLGYEIAYNLIDFTVKFDPGSGQFRFPKEVHYAGTSLFSELYEKPKKRHMAARMDEYMGSKLHFLRSLAAQNLTENKFEIFHEGWQVEPYKYFLIENEKSKTKVTMLVDTLSVLYDRTYQSDIKLYGEESHYYIDDYGVQYPVNALLFAGRIGDQRVSSMLPVDYNLK